MRLLTLGGLRLERSSLTRPKPLLLLAYLALEGPQEKRHLAELFWPQAKSAARSLNVALTQLRHDAPGAVEVREHRLETPVTTDAQAFLDLVEAGAADRAEACYRGAFLAGVRVPWGIELEEWILHTREFLGDHARAVALQRAEAEALEGRFREAARRAERAIALPGAGVPEPRELARVHTLLLAGNSAQAVPVRREAEAFSMELPRSVAEARRLLRTALDSDERPTATSTGTPRASSSFVGREVDVGATLEALQDGCRLLSLLGPPGVGKTRLALQCAMRLERNGDFEGVHFVALDAARDESQMLRAVAATLRPEDGALDGGVDRIAHFVGGRRVLLVLDNFEQLVASAGRLADLLSLCPELQLLVTSRERLNLRQERAHVVSGLAVPGSEVRADTAREFDAVELFTQRARRVRPDFALDEATLPSVLEICRLVDGLPLGLEIAAAWVRLMPVAAIASELAGNLDILESNLRDVPERHRNLRNAVAWSWNLLGGKEREVLAGLAVFRGGFTRDAAEPVAGATIPVLASLVDKSLVRHEATDRYGLHPLVAQYAREALDGRPDAVPCHERHGAYFLDLAERATPQLTGPDPSPWLHRLDAELDNLRAALEHFLVHDVARGMRLAAALWRFWIMRGHNQEGREVLERLVARRDTAKEGQLGALLLRALGTLTFQTGEFARAEPVLEQALEVGREHANENELATILNTLGWVTVHLGKGDASEGYCREALSLHERLGNVRGVALAHNDLGFLALFTGSFPDARSHLAESLRLFEHLGEERGVAHLRTNLAMVRGLMGAFQEAEALLDRALQTLRRIGDKQLLVWALYHRATVALDRERFDEARRFLHDALPVAQDVGNRELLGAVLTALADLLHEQGRPAEAERRLEEARRAWHAAGYPWMWAYRHRVLARVAQHQGRPTEARRSVRTSLELAFAIGDRHGVAQGAEEFAWISAERDPERAARLLATADAARVAAQAPLPPRHRARHERALASVRHRLGADRCEEAWRMGSTADLDSIRADADAIG